MADNVAVTPGTGKTVATDEVTDATLGAGVQVQFIKVMNGTLDATDKWVISSGGAGRQIIHDGTNQVAIKGTGTAAAASDPALVVALSPNGEVADDVVDSGTGNKIAAVARAGLATTTLVSTALDRIDLTGGMDRMLYVRPHCGLEDLASSAPPVTLSGTTPASVLAAGSAGVKNYITSVCISNSSATFTTVNLTNGSGGSVLWTLPVPPTSGVIQNFEPPLGGNSAATAIFAVAAASVTSLIVSVNGFRSKI